MKPKKDEHLNDKNIVLNFFLSENLVLDYCVI